MLSLYSRGQGDLKGRKNEKLAAGKPVVCSNIEPMPEFGEDAAVYFDPYDPDTLVEQIKSMFDLPLEDKLACKWKFDLPIDDLDWSIGLIVGPSGSGKSKSEPLKNYKKPCKPLPLSRGRRPLIKSNFDGR